MDNLGTGYDALLTRGAVVALLAAGLWATAVVAVVAVEAWTSRPAGLADRLGCPRPVRAWLLAVLLVVFAAVAPAGATGPGSGARAASGSAVADPARALDGLPLPDRPTGGRSVLVRPGDSLWRIARRVLPSDSPASAVAAAARRLYAANRATIGPDPDLVRPDQRLDVPTPLPVPQHTTPTEAP